MALSTPRQIKRRRMKAGALAVAAASLLTAGSVSLAGETNSTKDAQPASVSHFQQRSYGHAAGSISAIGDGSFTVDGWRGSTEVTLAEGASLLETTMATVADVAVGDYVLVAGRSGDDGTVDARHLAVKPAPEEVTVDDDGKRHRHWPSKLRAGTVTANEDGTLTIDTGEDELTVSTDEDTTTSVTAEVTFADLEVGDGVWAKGERDGDTLVADKVHVGTAFAKSPEPDPTTTTTSTTTSTTSTTAPEPPPEEEAPERVGVLGEVLSASAEDATITLRQRDESTVTVRVTDETVWNPRHGRSVGHWGDVDSVEDVKAGMWLKVKGTAEADGTIVADMVVVAGLHRGHDKDDWDRGRRDGDRRDHKDHRDHDRSRWDGDRKADHEWDGKDHERSRHEAEPEQDHDRHRSKHDGRGGDRDHDGGHHDRDGRRG